MRFILVKIAFPFLFVAGILASMNPDAPENLPEALIILSGICLVAALVSYFITPKKYK